MTKKELRIKYINLRTRLSIIDIKKQSVIIANQLLSLPIWDKKYYHLYLTIEHKKEVDTIPILTLLQAKGKTIIISKSDFSKMTMKHILLKDSTKIGVNDYGIPEPLNGTFINPQIIDVVFVPLLAFDSKSNRVGYGKGFYDRFLSSCNSHVIKVGLSFFQSESCIKDISPYDITLDYVVTPTKIYYF